MTEKGEHKPGNGKQSVLSVEADSIPEAWENSLIALNNLGLWYHREGEKDQGKLQVDASMDITIKEPLSRKYMMHRFMGCGWTDLLAYQMEILGAKDSWIDRSQKSTKWEYHYHERLADYPGVEGPNIDQIKDIIHKLSTESFKRDIQGVTYSPELDIPSANPPCLQRIWFTMIPNEQNPGESVLNMNYDFRSRNAMIAAPMNQLGFATLQEYIRREVVKQTGKNVTTGIMLDKNNSYHVRADNVQKLRDFMVEYERSIAKGETVADRCYSTEDVVAMMEESKKGVEDQIIAQTRKCLTGKSLDDEIEKIMKISEVVMGINRSLLPAA